MKTALPIICALFPLTTLAQSAQNDSIETQQLNEVVVEGQMQNVKPGISTYYPESNQKKSAQDAIDLLSQMGMAQISVNPVSNSVLTLNGNTVSIYIDKQPASQAQLDALKPEDVKKVVEIFNISMFRGDYQWVTNCCFQSGNNAVTPEVFYRHFPECIGMWRMAG